MSLPEPSSIKKNAILWGILLWLVHMSLLTPLFSITVWLASIPAVLLYVKTNRTVFAALAAASLAVCALLSGPYGFGFLWIALITVIPAAFMGEAYVKKNKAQRAILSGVISYLALFLASILFATLLGVNLTQSIGNVIRQSIAFMPETMNSIITDEMVHEFIQLTVLMIPFYLILTATALSVVTHAATRRISKLTGTDFPALPPIRDWRVPRSFVWYYLVVLFADMLVPKDNGSFLATVVVNIVPIFMSIFAIQGLSFLFFVGYIKRKMWIPWLGVLGVVFISPLFSAYSLLGVFDTAFPIRDRLRKS